MIESGSDTARYLVEWSHKKTQEACARLASPKLDYPGTMFVRGELSLLAALDAELSGETPLPLLKTMSYLDDY